MFLDAGGKELNQRQMELIKTGSKVELYVEQNPFMFDTKVGKTVHARVGTVLRVKRVRCLEIKPVLPAAKAVATVGKTSLTNPMDRILSDLVGSAVVFDLQQLLETYPPVVGAEGRNQLIQTIRTEAMEYLDQEMI